MVVTDNINYICDDGKIFRHKVSHEIMGTKLSLGENDIIENYEEIDNPYIQKQENLETTAVRQSIKTFQNNYKITISKSCTKKTNKKTIIISLTSYPLRINYVADVLRSVLEQEADCKFKVVLVLASVQFPNGEKDFPEDLKLVLKTGYVELIWVDKDLRSHKKLIPTLKKYPRNPILIIDDDIIRTPGWLQRFVEDHKKHPKDILAGTFMYHFSDGLKFHRFEGKPGAACGSFNRVGGIVFDFARPANGAGGVLYPPGTFNDKRFFNELLMMELCPFSDESWQYTFNIIENRNIRQLNAVWDNSEGVLPGSQQYGLYKKNRYDTIFGRLFTSFPELVIGIHKRMWSKVIVSMASYGKRLSSGTTYKAICSILNQTVKPSKIVLCIFWKDIFNIPFNIWKLVFLNKVKLFLCPKNLGPHNKWFWTISKYGYNPIVLVDDDIEYTPDMVESLLHSYIKYPNCVSARRVHKIVSFDSKILPYKQWVYECRTEKKPSYELFATNGGGTLYPPGLLCIDSSLLSLIKKCPTADDILLKYLQLLHGAEVVWAENDKPSGNQIKDDVVTSTALYKQNINGGLNDKYINELLNPIYIHDGTGTHSFENLMYHSYE